MQDLLRGPGISPGILQECETGLNSLRLVLSEKLLKPGIRGKIEMLTWPFSEADTKARVEMLDRFASLFSSSWVAENL